MLRKVNSRRQGGTFGLVVVDAGFPFDKETQSTRG